MATAEETLPIERDEEQDARELAARYRYEFVNLAEAHIDAELFRSIPVELMFRHNFVPLRADEAGLEIAIADHAYPPRRRPSGVHPISAALARTSHHLAAQTRDKSANPLLRLLAVLDVL